MVVSLSCWRVYVFVQISQWLLCPLRCTRLSYRSLLVSTFYHFQWSVKPCLFAAAVGPVQCGKRASLTSSGILNTITGPVDPPLFLLSTLCEPSVFQNCVGLFHGLMTLLSFCFALCFVLFCFFHFEFTSFSDVFRKTGGEGLKEWTTPRALLKTSSRKSPDFGSGQSWWVKS